MLALALVLAAELAPVAGLYELVVGAALVAAGAAVGVEETAGADVDAGIPSPDWWMKADFDMKVCFLPERRSVPYIFASFFVCSAALQPP